MGPPKRLPLATQPGNPYTNLVSSEANTSSEATLLGGVASEATLRVASWGLQILAPEASKSEVDRNTFRRARGHSLFKEVLKGLFTHSLLRSLCTEI